MKELLLNVRLKTSENFCIEDIIELAVDKWKPLMESLDIKLAHFNDIMLT